MHLCVDFRTTACIFKNKKTYLWTAKILDKARYEESYLVFERLEVLYLRHDFE